MLPVLAVVKRARNGAFWHEAVIRKCPLLRRLCGIGRVLKRGKEAAAAITGAAISRSACEQVPCRARCHADQRLGLAVPWVRSTPLLPGAFACYLAINCGCDLLLRSSGGDLGLLPIDTTKTDIAIGPS